MGNPVMHFEVVGRNAEALHSFYKDAFYGQIQPALPNYAMALPGADVGISGGIGATPDGNPGHVTFYRGPPRGTHQGRVLAVSKDW